MFYRSCICFLISLALMIGVYAGSVAYFCSECPTGFLFSCGKLNGLFDFYEKGLRGNLFSGFLALSGFLISLKAFIVVTMKEKVYDNENYKERWRQQSKLDDSLKLYGPLKELSDHLYFSVFVALVTAIAQVTIGLFPYWWFALACIFLAIFSMVLLFSCLALMKGNLNDWFKDIE